MPTISLKTYKWIAISLCSLIFRLHLPNVVEIILMKFFVRRMMVVRKLLTWLTTSELRRMARTDDRKISSSNNLCFITQMLVVRIVWLATILPDILLDRYDRKDGRFHCFHYQASPVALARRLLVRLSLPSLFKTAMRLQMWLLLPYRPFFLPTFVIHKKSSSFLWFSERASVK